MVEQNVGGTSQGRLATASRRVCYVTGELPHFQVGGAQVATYRLARHMARRGWETHAVVNHRSSSPNTQLLDGIIVHRVHYPPARWATGFAGKIRWYALRLADVLTSGSLGLYAYNDVFTALIATFSRGFAQVSYSYEYLFNALAEADTEIYVGVSSDAWTGYVSEFAKRLRRPFVFIATHIDHCDLSFSGKLWEGRDHHSKQQYVLGLERADAIVVLANYMKDTLPPQLRRKCHVIPLGVEPPEGSLTIKRDPPFILWTSGMRSYKRPFEVLEIASKLPNVKFVVCGTGPLYDEFVSKASSLSNIEIRGDVQFEKIDLLFGQAALTLNTSESEGFPDSFIRSWMHQTPVVTVRVDPDEVICRNQLGYHSGSTEKAARDIAMLIQDRMLRAQIGARCKAFALKHFHIDQMVESHLRLYEELLSTYRS